MSDRKRMKKLREKRIKTIDRQILAHESKIKHEHPPKDTTLDYWKKEIEEKFKKMKKEDEEYLKDED
ncbi:MAG: hypothetical protein WC533_00945 [Candidatus Pacearchaeota archaeon]